LRESFAIGFEQLTDGIFPFEVAAGQMRPRLQRDGAVYGMRFRPVLEEGVMVRVLVILTDVTSTVEGERAQRRAREVEAVMLSFVRDRDGMIAFVREAERILLDLEHVEEPATVRRLVHTLKGGSAAAGFVTVAEECHAIESELLESGQPTLERAQHVRLSRAFQERLGMIAELLPSDDGTRTARNAPSGRCARAGTVARLFEAPSPVSPPASVLARQHQQPLARSTGTSRLRR